ncbi:MAG: hypothetical protein ACMXYF_04705 [Candidatus Woesearchaeota archaeon]
MLRKINLVGTGTYTVSLPSTWVKENSLQKGDILSVDSDNHVISYSVHKKKTQKSIEICIDNFDYLQLSKTLIILYNDNFEKIILRHSKSHIEYKSKNESFPIIDILHKLVNRHIGMELTDLKSKYSQLEVFLRPLADEPQVIELRIYYILKEYCKSLLEGPMDENSEQNSHDTAVKFIFYYLRLINYSKSVSVQRICSAYMIRLDSLCDTCRHLNQDMKVFNLSKETKELMEKIFSWFFEVIKPSVKISDNMIKQRYKLLEELKCTKLTHSDWIIASQLRQFLDSFNEISLFKQLSFIEDNQVKL